MIATLKSDMISLSFISPSIDWYEKIERKICYFDYKLSNESKFDIFPSSSSPFSVNPPISDTGFVHANQIYMNTEEKQ